MANLVIKISGSHTAQDLRNAVAFGGGKNSPSAFLTALGKDINKDSLCELQLLKDDAVAASGTITFSDKATANDTVIVNGVTFTAKASGAAGNQWNVGAAGTATAANLAAAIVASATADIKNYVTASSAAGVLTIKAKIAGDSSGNNIAIATGVDSGTVQTVSVPKLAGGADDTGVSVNYKAW